MDLRPSLARAVEEEMWSMLPSYPSLPVDILRIIRSTMVKVGMETWEASLTAKLYNIISSC